MFTEIKSIRKIVAIILMVISRCNWAKKKQ